MIEIVEHQPAWPDAFRELAASLRRLLGERAVRIDHIGSTSVAGLAAKDRIDIQVTVADFASLDSACVAALAAEGFELLAGYRSDHRPPGGTQDAGSWEKRVLKVCRERHRAANVHVRKLGMANQRYALLFRDFLRAHEDFAAAYEAAKRKLAVRFERTADYADVKDPICDLILCAAERWARASGWRPGPSDA